jgi:hypothetical protein
MTLAALWALITSKFTALKWIFYAIILAAVIGLGWYSYDKFTDTYVAKGAATQKATDDKVIAKLQAQVAQDAKDLAVSKGQTASAQKTLGTYVTQYNQYVAETKANQAKLLAEQQAALAKLNTKLGTLNTQLQNAQLELTNAIPTYFPPSSAATCQLSLGLVQIYNASLTGTDSSGGFTDPFGVSSNAGAASGVSCSTFAGYVVNNGIAAYRNRELLISWQGWYTDNEAFINAAIQAGDATKTPVTPTTTTPASTPASTTPKAVPTTSNAPQIPPAASGLYKDYMPRLAA